MLIITKVYLFKQLIGNSLHNLGKYVEAIKCFEEALKIDPYFFHAYNEKGNNSFFKLGNSLYNLSNYE